jgi:putative hydrolase of the HAD superfamily
MLRAVLFDMDDTLIDWSGFNEDWPELERRFMVGVHDYLEAEGLLTSGLDAYLNEFRRRISVGWMNSRTSLEALHIGRLIVETAQHLGAPLDRLDMARLLEVYAWDVVPGTVVFPDVIETLALLTASEIQIGIVTNAPQPMTLRDRELVTHGLFDYFPACRISAADVGVLKPHPAIFQHALDLLGVTADEAVFVGDDLEADIAGAKQMGIRSVLRVTRHTINGHRRHDIVPDARIHSFHELPGQLDIWFPGWRPGGEPSATSG